MSVRSSQLHSVALCLRLDEAAREVVTALDEEDIASVVLKGPTISRWLYEGPAERSYSDIDLLIDPRQAGRATEVLRGLGFEAPIQTIPGNRAPHAISWSRARDGASIDLHTTLEGPRLAPEELWDRVQGEVEGFDLGGRTVHALSTRGRSLLVALHAAQDGLQGNQAIADLRRAIDVVPISMWREAATLAYDLEAQGAMAAGLNLIVDGRALAGEIGLPSGLDVEAAIFASSARGERLSFALGVDWLASRRTLKQKVAFVGRKVFPPRAWIIERYELPADAGLRLAGAYVKRFGWLVWNLPPGVRVWWRARRQARGARIGD